MSDAGRAHPGVDPNHLVRRDQVLVNSTIPCQAIKNHHRAIYATDVVRKVGRITTNTTKDKI
jgi:hypothetical protein